MELKKLPSTLNFFSQLVIEHTGKQTHTLFSDGNGAKEI